MPSGYFQNGSICLQSFSVIQAGQYPRWHWDWANDQKSQPRADLLRKIPQALPPPPPPKRLNIDRCINLSGPFRLQSPQVDLLTKSEIFDGVAVVCDATGVTLLGDSEGMLSQKILKTGGS